LSCFTLTLLLSHQGRGNDSLRSAPPYVIESATNAERGNLHPPQPTGLLRRLRLLATTTGEERLNDRTGNGCLCLTSQPTTGSSCLLPKFLHFDLSFCILTFDFRFCLAFVIAWGRGGGAVMPRLMRYIDKSRAAVIIKSKAILPVSPIYLLTK
jgi:hypothetical protein